MRDARSDYMGECLVIFAASVSIGTILAALTFGAWRALFGRKDER